MAIAKGFILAKDNPIYQAKVLGGFTISQKEFAEILYIELKSFNGKPNVSKAGDFRNFIQGCYNAFVPNAGNPSNFRFIFQQQITAARPIVDTTTNIKEIHSVQFSHNNYSYATNLYIGYTKDDIIRAWIEPLDSVCPLAWTPQGGQVELEQAKEEETEQKTDFTYRPIPSGAQQPIIQQEILEPTIAPNLSYRVGRESDDENAIKQQIKENLAKIPNKPPQKSTPIETEPTQSFTDYPAIGTRFITLPITSNYTLKLLDRFENIICSVPYNASQTRIELPINTLGSFYEIVPSKQRFYIHNGKGELLFEDATKHLDLSRLERFCMPLRDKKGAFVIMEHFLKDLSNYLLGTKKYYDVETTKAIELFLYIFDRNNQRGKHYLECAMVEAIDRELGKMTS